ncbi:MAG TPA: PD-(D/E)XK nuclease family protein [Pseudolabrys sp.]|nr:PD-(D/E)XK nuclease family protein [Pseudolabrys sp.]
MSSLYGRLFKYRSREARSPLEDYLSEATADIFNRLNLEQQIDFIRRLFVPLVQLSAWDSLVANTKEMRLETQYPIQSGRIDLVLIVDERPIIAIENKISAPIATYSEDDDQLVTYGRWIRSHKREGTPSIVCLLTHMTRPSDGFLHGGANSGGATPHVVRWSTLGRALNTLRKDESVPLNARMLSEELSLFLGERGMSGEFAGRDEFAAAIVYLRAGDRMSHTFETIYLHLKSLNGQFTANESIHEMSLHFGTKENLIWGWKYLSHPTLHGLFFAYGIALDPANTFKESSAPKHDAAFICVGAEDKKSMASLRSAKEIPQKPWIYTELKDWSAVISFKPLHQMMADPETFAPQMIGWIDSEVDDINSFVRKLK